MINWKLLKIFGIVLGILAIGLACFLFSESVGYYESSYTYGGDAYTGIQNSAAQTANNVKYAAETLRMGLAFFLIVQGLAMLLGALCIRTKAAPASPVAAAPVMPMAPAAPVMPMAPAAPAEPVAPVAPAAPVAAPAPAAEPGLWVCPTCGKHSPVEFLFCEVCGTRRP